jgi:hypothetical protein
LTKKRLPGRKRLSSRRRLSKERRSEKIFLSPSAVRSRLVPEEITKI